MVGRESSSASHYKIFLKSDNPSNNIYFNNIPQVKFLGDPPFELDTYPPHLIYTSSNDSVVKVHGDTVRMVGLGSVNIIATIPGDSSYYPYSSSSPYFTVGNKTQFILGKDFVTANTGATYSIKDTSANSTSNNYSYSWSYSGAGAWIVSPLDVSQKSTITVFFSDTAASGTLSCQISSYGVIYTYFTLYKDITVNHDQTGSNGVTGSSCDQNIISCTDNYIDNFTLNTLVSDKTGCSPNGYIDYTSAKTTTTLFLGGVYSPHIRLGGKDSINRYVAVWLDYDNSGDFNNTTEFLGAAFTNNYTVTLDNLIIKNQSDYAGPRRLRVRTRTNGGFDPNESCPLPNESGETEDYLVTLKEQDALEAPEIITPNNDGKNDYFVIRGVNSKASNHLAVFDRLGLQQYEAENYDNSWNGVDHHGNPVPPGTYYYVFKNGSATLRGFLEIRY
jgi:gliding motility-associated-like protein